MYAAAQSLQDLPAPIPHEIEHFFTTYKLLEGKPVQSFGWADVAAAHQAIVPAHTAYRQS